MCKRVDVSERYSATPFVIMFGMKCGRIHLMSWREEAVLIFIMTLTTYTTNSEIIDTNAFIKTTRSITTVVVNQIYNTTLVTAISDMKSLQ